MYNSKSISGQLTTLIFNESVAYNPIDRHDTCTRRAEMKNQLMIKSIAGAAMVMGSMSVMATGFGGGWSHDPNTNTLMNASAPSYTSSSSTGMKSKMGSEFGGGLSQDSNTGTLMNANAPSYEKQPNVSSDNKVTLNGFGGGVYQNATTGTFTRMY